MRLPHIRHWNFYKLTFILAIPAGVMLGLALGGHPTAWCLLPWAAGAIAMWFILRNEGGLD